jgi:hypothetical protein
VISYLEKNLSQKRTGKVAEVIEHLPSKHEALSSNSSTTKKKKKSHRSSGPFLDDTNLSLVLHASHEGDLIFLHISVRRSRASFSCVCNLCCGSPWVQFLLFYCFSRIPASILISFVFLNIFIILREQTLKKSEGFPC